MGQFLVSQFQTRASSCIVGIDRYDVELFRSESLTQAHDKELTHNRHIRSFEAKHNLATQPAYGNIF